MSAIEWYTGHVGIAILECWFRSIRPEAAEIAITTM